MSANRTVFDYSIYVDVVRPFYLISKGMKNHKMRAVDNAFLRVPVPRMAETLRFPLLVTSASEIETTKFIKRLILHAHPEALVVCTR